MNSIVLSGREHAGNPYFMEGMYIILYAMLACLRVRLALCKQRANLLLFVCKYDICSFSLPSIALKHPNVCEQYVPLFVG
jgi:hypothetical protein